MSPSPKSNRQRKNRYNKDLGDRGEALVASWYEARGWIVVDRNYRLRTGEIDLICVRSGFDSAFGTVSGPAVRARSATVAFVEVKTRRSDRFGGAAAAVGYRKQQTIRATATQWLAEQRTHFHELRFDVATVGPDEVITVYEACF